MNYNNLVVLQIFLFFAPKKQELLVLLLWKKLRNGSYIPSNSKQPTKTTNPNFTIYWMPRIRLQYILTTSPALNSSSHINRICFHFAHNYLQCPIRIINARSKKHKNNFYFFLFYKKPNDAESDEPYNFHRRRRMKITALLVLKCNPDGSDPVLLATALDVSHFGYFQRSSVKEFILFVARTVGKRTPPGQRQSVQHEGPIFNFRLQSVSHFFIALLCLNPCSFGYLCLTIVKVDNFRINERFDDSEAVNFQIKRID